MIVYVETIKDVSDNCDIVLKYAKKKGLEPLEFSNIDDLELAKLCEKFSIKIWDREYLYSFEKLIVDSISLMGCEVRAISKNLLMSESDAESFISYLNKFSDKDFLVEVI